MHPHASRMREMRTSAIEYHSVEHPQLDYIETKTGGGQR